MNAEVSILDGETTSFAIVEYTETEAALASLREKHKGVVFDLTTTKGDKEARAARQELVRLRTGLDKLRLKLNAGDRARIERRNSEATRITSEIEALENPIDQQIKADEQRKEDERQAKIAAEQKRVADLQERVAELRGNTMLTPASGSQLIGEHVSDLESIVVDDSFQEFREQAEDTKAKGLDRLRRLHSAAVTFEEQQQRLEKERAALVRQQAEDRRIAAIRKRIDGIRAYAINIARLKARELKGLIVDAESIDIGEGFEELRDEAVMAQQETLGTLRITLTEREAQDAETERVAREKAEQEVAAAKERERIAEEERQAKLRRDEEQRRHDEQLRQQREEEERKTEERRRILEAEEAAAAQRIADQQAELDRQRQALQVQQETMAAPSDPVEATSTEVVAAAPAESQVFGACVPTADDIIDLVARTYFVPESTAAGWLANMAFGEVAA